MARDRSRTFIATARSSRGSWPSSLAKLAWRWWKRVHSVSGICSSYSLKRASSALSKRHQFSFNPVSTQYYRDWSRDCSNVGTRIGGQEHEVGPRADGHRSKWYLRPFQVRFCERTCIDRRGGERLVGREPCSHQCLQLAMQSRSWLDGPDARVRASEHLDSRRPQCGDASSNDRCGWSTIAGTRRRYRADPRAAVRNDARVLIEPLTAGTEERAHTRAVAQSIDVLDRCLPEQDGVFETDSGDDVTDDRHSRRAGNS